MAGLTTRPTRRRSATEFSLGHTVRSEEEVDSVMQKAERAGATVVKKPREIAYNPSLLPDD